MEHPSIKFNHQQTGRFSIEDANLHEIGKDLCKKIFKSIMKSNGSSLNYKTNSEISCVQLRQA
jgi:hypothetical protein